MFHFCFTLRSLYTAGDNTDLSFSRNMSKTAIVNIAFKSKFFKEYSISFLRTCRFMDLAFVVLKFLMLNVCGIIGILKIDFLNFSDTERFKQNKKNQKPFKASQACKSITFQVISTKSEYFLVFHWNFNPFAPCTPLESLYSTVHPCSPEEYREQKG